MFTANLSFMLETFDRLYSEPLILIPLTLFLLIATWTDIKTLKIPNKLNGAFFLVRLLLIPFIGFGINEVVGAFFAFFLMMIPAMIMMHKMGGDIKCLTVVGLYVGIGIVPMYLIVTCALFLLYALIMLLIKKPIKNVPFAPFFLSTHAILIVVHMLFI